MSENLYGQNKPQGQSQQPGHDQNSQTQDSQAQRQYQGQVPQNNSSQQGNYQGNGAQNSYQQQYPQQPQQGSGNQHLFYGGQAQNQQPTPSAGQPSYNTQYSSSSNMVSGQQQYSTPSTLRRPGRMPQDRATPHSRTIIQLKVTTNISRLRIHGVTLSRGTPVSRVVIRHRITKALRDTRTSSNRDLHSRKATVRILPRRSRTDHLSIMEILPTPSRRSKPPTELLVLNLHSKMLSRATVSRILTRSLAGIRTSL